MKGIRRLDFGCGYKGSRTFYNKPLKGKYLTADLSGADYNFDFNKFPYPFPDNYFDEIVAKSSINHLDNFDKVINELYRISKPNALVKIAGSFYNCANAFLPTHKIKFTYATFAFLSNRIMTPTPELDIVKKTDFEIEEFYTSPGIFGKFIPDIRFSKKKLGLRYLLGMLFGDIVVTLWVVLRVIKPPRKPKQRRC